MPLINTLAHFCIVNNEEREFDNIDTDNFIILYFFVTDTDAKLERGIVPSKTFQAGLISRNLL
jgi:hypothetical protein